MAPKKSPAAAATKKAAPAPTTHASYQDMIKEAILKLKERNGSSRQAIKKYIQANKQLGATTDTAFNSHINKALATGEKNGTFSRPKGPSGPVKLAKKDASKPIAKPAPIVPVKAATKTTKSKTTAKKGATKKATTAKAAPEKSAPAVSSKPKANASRPRKTAPIAPAVESKPPVILGKTKSGRVTKSIAPIAPKVTRKASTTPSKTKADTKKADAKKTSTPKKSEKTEKSTTPTAAA